MYSKRILALVGLALLAAGYAQAGIARHVVKPAAKATVKVIARAAKITKTVVY